MATEDLTFRFNVTGNAVPQFQAVQKQVRAVDNQVKRTTATVRDHANQYNRTAVATNKWAKGALQQAGFQIGDYAVQVANGTSKMQAFGQQGSQLLGVFGPIGAVLGAGVAIISAVAIAFEKSGKTAKSFGDSMDDLTSSISSYQSLLAKTNKDTDDLAEQYGNAADQAQKLFEAQSSLKRLEAIDLLKKSVIALRDNFGSFAEVSRAEIEKTEETFNRLGEAVRTNYPPLSDQDLRAAINAVDVFDSKIADLKKTLGATDEQAFALAKELSDLGAAEGPQQVSRELEDVRTQFLSIIGSIDSATDEQRKLYEQLIQSAIAALDLGDNVKAAESAATGFADEMQRAAAAVQNINVSAFNKLAALQAELRGRSRGLTDDQIRIQQAARKAELRAKKEGATGSELAAIAAEAAAAEREIIAAESSITLIKEAAAAAGSVGGGAMERIKSKTKEVVAELTPLQQKMQSVGDAVASSMEGAFMSIVDGTSSAKDAFRNMASSIIKELYRIFVVKRITGFISNAISGLFGPGMTTGTPLQAPSGSGASLLPPKFSGGGYTGNRARAGGLDGKGGFMAMMHPRETVIDHTKGQSAGGVVVNQTINVSTGVQQTVRTEIKSLMPQIAESAKSAVVDAKRRGGSYGRSFA